MEPLQNTLILMVGLVCLGIGGEMLVRGAARLARTLGVSTLVVGLTVVAFGTSAPEAAVTVTAAARGTEGATGLAVGNVVGSNIANILLILGFAAVVRPLVVSHNLIRFDGPVMILSAAALTAIAWWIGSVGRVAGIVFVTSLLAYTVFTYCQARQRPVPEVAEEDHPKGIARHWWYNAALIVIGVVGLVGGAQLIVHGASELARAFGVSDHLIGLTIVAIGTSLPELATAVAAARQRQSDIAIGNVIGSNIFNVLFVTGLASMVTPLPVPSDIVHLDAPLMLGICVLTFPVMWTGRKIVRWEGAVLLGGYVAYLVWTGMRAM